MDDIVNVGAFLTNAMSMLWNGIGTYGVIGFGIVIMLILPKLLKLIKKLFAIK